jgi:excisionase family DNA binding protein
MDSATVDLLSLTEASEILHVSKSHLSNIVAGRVRGCNAIPAIRLGRRMLIRRESLLSWIEQNDRIAASPERADKDA